MGMDTPKMDGSVEPNSWLEEEAETQCDSTRLGDFTFDWQPNGKRHYDTMCRHGDYITKCVSEMLFSTYCLPSLRLLD